MRCKPFLACPGDKRGWGVTKMEELYLYQLRSESTGNAPNRNKVLARDMTHSLLIGVTKLIDEVIKNCHFSPCAENLP